MKQKRNFTGLWLLLLKAMMYVGVCGTFFFAMGIENPQMMRLSRTSGVTLVTFLVLGAVLISVYGGYDIGGQKTRPIIVSTMLAVMMTDCVVYLQMQIMNVNANNYARLTLFGPSFGHLIAAMLIQAMIVYGLVHAGNRLYFMFNKPQRSVIITTEGADEREMRRKISQHAMHCDVVGTVDYRDPRMEEILEENDTFFFGEVPLEERMALMERCYAKHKNLYYRMGVPDVIEYCAHHVIVDDMPFMRVSAQELTMEQRMVKRLMDIVVSLIALLVLSPVMLVCAAAIKLCDGGCVFYRQARVTRGGRIFSIYKFRSMDEEVHNHSVTCDDARITPVGKVLRKWRLDELPQLINILKGDMSLVGPRPEMIENVEQYTREMPAFTYRLKVKAGLTGYAQIEGKYNTTPRDKMIMDLMYIERYSLWRDIKLLLRTFTVFFKPDSTEAFETAPESPDDRKNKKSA